MIKKLFYQLTRGRPMKYIAFAFTDSVTGERVNYYECQLTKRVYLANTRWSLFRVASSWSSVDQTREINII